MHVFTVFTTLSFPLTWAFPHLQHGQFNCTVGQSVETSSGDVTGHAATDYSEVSEYLGIPFAQPPVGELRFAAPVKYSGSSKLNGSVFVSSELRSSHFLQLTYYRGFHALIFLSNRLLQHQKYLPLQTSPMSD